MLLDSAIVLERLVVRCQLSSPAVLGHRFPAHTYKCKVICHISLLSASIILWSIAIHGGVAEGKQRMLSTAPDEKGLNCPIIALNSVWMEHNPRIDYLICTGPCNIGYGNYAGGWNTSSQLADEQVAGRQGCFEQERRVLDSTAL